MSETVHIDAVRSFLYPIYLSTPDDVHVRYAFYEIPGVVSRERVKYIVHRRNPVLVQQYASLIDGGVNFSELNID